MQSPKRLKCLTIDELFNRQLQRNEGTINCPVCKVKVKKSYINSHLDNDCILEYESKEDKPKWDSGDNNKSGSNTGIIKEDDRLLSRDVGTQENENFSPYFQSSGINNIIGDTDVEIISVKRKLSLTSKKKAAFVSKKRTTSDVAHDTAFLDINDYCRTVIEESSEILDVNVSQMVLESTSSSSSSAQKNSNESDDDVIEILDEHTLNNSASTQPLKSSPNNETHCTVSDSLNSQQHSGTSTLLALPNVCNEDEEIPFYTRELINKLPNYFQDVKLELSSSAVLNKLNEVQHLPYPKANRDSLDSSSEQNRHFTTSDSAENKKYLPYYINNFLEILKVVLDTPDDFFLFNYDDLEILRNFYLLSSPSQQLYVRMFSRKHKWIQQTKIDYPKIAVDLRPAFQELTEKNFVENNDLLDDLQTVLKLLSVGHVKQLCKDFNVKASAQKSDMVEKLMQHWLKQRGLSSMTGFGKSLKELIVKKAKVYLGGCIRLKDNPRSLFLRIMMLYSLTDPVVDTKQEDAPVQLTALLMTNNGKWLFPPYEIFRTAKIFRSRDDLLNFEKGSVLEMEILSAIESKKWDEAKSLCNQALAIYDTFQQQHDVIRHDAELPVFLRRYTYGHILIRCIHHRVEVLQKLKLYDEAVVQLQSLLKEQIYCQTYYGRWVERLALNLEQYLKNPLKALEVIASGLNSPRVSHDHKLSLQERAERILKSKRTKHLAKNFDVNFSPISLSPPNECHIDGRVISHAIPGSKSFFVSDRSNETNNEREVAVCSVEEFALIHYLSQGYTDGFHAEGSALVSLFALLFWDVIYSPGIPDAFRSPHQICPLDLRCTEFYNNRRPMIDHHINFLENGGTEIISELISETWQKYEGYTCLVNWELFGSCERAQGLAICIGNTMLTQICRRFIEDFRRFHSGIPDLTVWNLEIKTWKMVEVKGPNDHLSYKQLLWLDFLKNIGVNAEVCYVKAVGAKKLHRMMDRKDSNTNDVYEDSLADCN